MNARRSKWMVLGGPQRWLVLAMLAADIIAVSAIALCVHDPQGAALGTTMLAMLMAALP